LEKIISEYPDYFIAVCGRGLIYGLECRHANVAKIITSHSFEGGLIIETAGVYDEVIKFLPALTIPDELLVSGLDLIEQVIGALKDEIK
jgi:diaminobutyrate-2-oxoglutarate transaminase